MTTHATRSTPHLVCDKCLKPMSSTDDVVMVCHSAPRPGKSSNRYFDVRFVHKVRCDHGRDEVWCDLDRFLAQEWLRQWIRDDSIDPQEAAKIANRLSLTSTG